MKKGIMAIWAAGLTLMSSSCVKVGKFDGNVIDGGHGIGIDTATVNKLDFYSTLDSIEADTIANDEPAPKDEMHTEAYITTRVKSFYKSLDDKQCCSENYLKLHRLTEQICKQKGEDIKNVLSANHWTMGDQEDVEDKDWSYQIMEVNNITKHRAEVLIYFKKYYETNAQFTLVLERGNWYVDNFIMLTQTGFDAVVEVYEEQEVYYNEKEMMLEYLRSAYEE